MLLFMKQQIRRLLLHRNHKKYNISLIKKQENNLNLIKQLR